MPTVEIINPAIQPMKRKYADKDVPYQNKEAREIADRIFKNTDRTELENCLFDIDDAQKMRLNQVKIKGDLSDKTHHSLFQMGFRMRMGYEKKPAHMVNANTEDMDFNKPFVIITW